MTISHAVMEQTPVSLYLHIPFCRTKCTYCAFNTYVNIDELIPAFVQALMQEIRIVGQSQTGTAVGTIFFGGGTPSLLTPQQIESLLDTIKANFDLLPDSEISLESNPSDLDYAYLAALRARGINRLSIGMQSAIDNELVLFARRHDNDMTAKAFGAARAAGFDDVNLDLIYGVPHQTLESWQTTLQQALALRPDHLSLYALGLEEGTAMTDWVARGRLPEPDDDLTADMYDLATDMLAQAGYDQYEISNWARPGHECRHNLQYWRNLPYAGLGPGAHGYAGGVRYATILAPQRYIQAMRNEGGKTFEFPYTPATDEPVVVDREAEIAETLIMGLRLTQEGIKRETFQQRFGIDLVELHRSVIEKYTKFGLLHVDDDVVRITQKGRLLSNAIFRELV
ncbi:MAG: radical SAM family heme chaperone HemW [Burkholderiales bacterium]|nr:radical SAM family heme chaperone HemW [Anaerolineae bacterium]